MARKNRATSVMPGLRSIVGAVLAVAACVGFARGEPSAPTPPEVIFTSAGRIVYLTVQPDAEGRRVLVAEAVKTQAIKGKSQEKIQLRWVDLATREVGAPVESPWPSDVVPRVLTDTAGDVSPHLKVSPDGRLAAVASEKERVAIFVRDPPQAWSALGFADNDSRFEPRWSPDSRHLAYVRIREQAPEKQEPIAMDWMVAHVPPEGGRTKEKVLVPNAAIRDSAAWSADGRHIYYIRGDNSSSYRLLRAPWPEEGVWKTLLTANHVYPLQFAPETGDAFAVTGQLGVKGHAEPIYTFWRIPPDGEPVRTQLRLQQAPRLLEVSPDGRQVALAPASGKGVILGDLQNGVKRPLQEASAMLPKMLGWGLGGRVLLVAPDEGGVVKRVWAIPAQRILGPQGGGAHREATARLQAHGTEGALP